MNATIIVLLILGAISLAFFLWKRDEKGSALATILKTLTSLFFIATAFAAFLKNYSDYPRYEIVEFFALIAAGLVMGMIGDILLDLKIAYPKDNDIYTYSGMSAFAIGHIFYLIALIMFFKFNVWALAVAAVLTIAIVSTSIFVMKLNFGKFIIPAVIYSFLLCYVMCQGVYAAIAESFSAITIVIALGGIFFLISDAILSMTYFGGKNSKLIITANHITYYIAQFLLAVSILLI